MQRDDGLGIDALLVLIRASLVKADGVKRL